MLSIQSRLKEMPAIIIRSYAAKSNVLMVGKPALGKTDTMHEITKKMQARIEGFRLWSVYAPDLAPTDVQAAMPDTATGKLKIYTNELLPNHYDDPGLKGIVFFGEMLNADPTVLKLLQKYCNGEDMSGKLRKPDGVIVVADSNRIEDKSGVQQQGRAYLSRFEQHEVFTTPEDNVEFARDHSWHPYVQDFFKNNPDLIDTYDETFFATTDGRAKPKDASIAIEEGKRGLWANMRGWYRISTKEYVADEMGSEVTLAEVAGSIGSPVARKYYAHREYMTRLTSLEDILKKPETIDIPAQVDEQYAVSTMVSLRCKEDDLPKVYLWAQRIRADLQVGMIRRMTLRKNFAFTTSDTYKKWISNKELRDLVTQR